MCLVNKNTLLVNLKLQASVLLPAAKTAILTIGVRSGIPCHAVQGPNQEKRVDKWKPPAAEVGSSDDQGTMAATSPGERVVEVSSLDTSGQGSADG